METVVENEIQIDLFAESLPSIEEINQLLLLVHSSQTNLLAFKAQVEDNLSKSNSGVVLAAGIGLYILGCNSEAVEKLQKASDCKEKFIFLAYALRRLFKFDEAIDALGKSLAHDADQLLVNLEKAATYRHSSNYEAAQKELDACGNFQNVSADYHYQIGRLQEEQGQYEQAMDNYIIAIELSPNHRKALFHLAYRSDLCGDEDAAIDYYQQISCTKPVYVSALMNLAVLYEDNEKYTLAEQCIEKVLKSHPNHQRAIMFAKDIESSKTMVYDEEKEKKLTRRSQTLETPISDFELSVRSRNCLKKMNINTIGDLLNISEAELLSYKNFGETSLREIKHILDSKGLILGMSTEDEQLAAPEAMEFAPEPVDDVNEELLNKTVDDLQLSVRARNCLAKLNLRTIRELVYKTEAELLGCKNFGATSLVEIKKALNILGLSLRNID